MFTVNIPFGPFETGDQLTAEVIRGRVPGCDLVRLVTLGSLVPVEGFDVGTLADPTASQEQAEDVIADLHAKVIVAEDEADAVKKKLAEALPDLTRAVAAADSMSLKLAECRNHLATAAEGKMNLQVLTDIPDGPKAGEIIGPATVAVRLSELLDSGAVGWTEKPVAARLTPEQTADLASKAEFTTHTVNPAAKDDDTAEIVPPVPAVKKKGK